MWNTGLEKKQMKINKTRVMTIGEEMEYMHTEINRIKTVQVRTFQFLRVTIYKHSVQETGVNKRENKTIKIRLYL